MQGVLGSIAVEGGDVVRDAIVNFALHESMVIGTGEVVSPDMDMGIVTTHRSGCATGDEIL